MVFLKSLYERTGAFDSRFPHGDDFEWVVRAVMAGAYCTRIDQKLFLYRRHGGNLTNNAIAFLETWLTVYEERMKTAAWGRNVNAGPETLPGIMCFGFLESAPPRKADRCSQGRLKPCREILFFVALIFQPIWGRIMQ